jgi:hypothetical protein
LYNIIIAFQDRFVLYKLQKKNMETDTNENHGLDDRNSLINHGNQGSIPENDDDDDDDDDDDKIEKEVDTPSQPAEEHLITEADDLHNNPEEKPKRPLVD